MTDHISHDRLQDLADGAVDPIVEMHVAECAPCRAELDAIRRLKVALATLPREDRVEYSLFPLIKARISPRRNYWKAAALALAAGLAFAVITPRVKKEEPPPRSDLRGEIQGASQQYRRALDEMIDELNTRKDSLDPKTVSVVEDNLKQIDEAIKASEKALDADPGNREAALMVASAYESKLDLLRLIERTGQ